MSKSTWLQDITWLPDMWCRVACAEDAASQILHGAERTTPMSTAAVSFLLPASNFFARRMPRATGRRPTAPHHSTLNRKHGSNQNTSTCGADAPPGHASPPRPHLAALDHGGASRGSRRTVESTTGEIEAETRTTFGGRALPRQKNKRCSNAASAPLRLPRRG